MIDGVSARAQGRPARALRAWRSAVMALVLLLVFRSRWPLLPLGDRADGGGDHLRAAGAGRRFADDGLDRGAADPDRARGGLRDPVPGALSTRTAGAVRGGAAARTGRPTIAAACLRRRPGSWRCSSRRSPMVRGFGWLLIVGIAVAFALALDGRVRGAGDPAGGWRWAQGTPGLQRGRDPGRPRPPARRRALLSLAVANPAAVLAVGLGTGGHGVGGWDPGRDRVRHPRAGAAEHRRRCEGLNELQDTTGVSGELDVQRQRP